MKNMIKLVQCVCIIVLVGCTQTLTGKVESQSNEILQDQSLTKPAGFLEEVAKIEIGTTREDIIDNIGPFDFGLTPIGFTAICDSYGYVADGQQFFVQIWYDRSNGVKRVGVKRRSPCGIV